MSGNSDKSSSARERIITSAAAQFSAYGFVGASMREIAREANLEPASMYYYFNSKEDLLLAVEEEAFRRVTEGVRADLKGLTDPWDRLEAACGAHLESVLANREYMDVTSRELPHTRSPKSRERFRKLRSDYERVFRDLIDDLPLDPSVDRRYFRLALLGAMAWSLVWYRPDREDSPREIGTKILRVLRQGETARTGAPVRAVNGATT